MSAIDIINFTPSILPNVGKTEEKENYNSSHSDTRLFYLNYHTSLFNDREVLIDPSKTLMTKTSAQGILEYANEYFMEVTGFTQKELIGKPHQVIRHPDMPQCIYHVINEHLSTGKNVNAVLKNITKDGKYYWVIVDLEANVDENGTLVSYYSRRKAIPKNFIPKIEKFYNNLKMIEQRQNVEFSLKYLEGLLEDQKLSFTELILNLLEVEHTTLENYFSVKIKVENTPKKENLFSKLFSFF